MHLASLGEQLDVVTDLVDHLDDYRDRPVLASVRFAVDRAIDGLQLAVNRLGDVDHPRTAASSTLLHQACDVVDHRDPPTADVLDAIAAKERRRARGVS